MITTENSSKDEFRSPIEEHHIDFILEEEFIADPGFLDFFLQKASERAPNKASPARKQDGSCQAVRSAVTTAGETDVLIRYACEAPEGETAAILIENKIAASFEPNQAERYRERGEAGNGSHWHRYWTCLVAPERYRSEEGVFDARVSLESLREYFALQEGPRGQFRTKILDDAIARAAFIGVKRVDPVLTAFKARYAALAAAHFSGRGWEWDQPREAWADDTWFRFKRTHWPNRLQILHKAKAGLVHLVLPATEVSDLDHIVRQTAPGKAITAVQTHRSASFQIAVPSFLDFSKPIEERALEEVFSAVEELGSYAQSVRSQLMALNALAGSTWEESARPDFPHTKLRSLEVLLLGLIRSQAINYQVAMTWPLPDMVALASTEAKETWYPLAGLYGGFHVRLLGTSDEPYLTTEHWSRVWDFGVVQHKITLQSVELVSIKLPY